MRLADRIVVMSEGRIEQVGPPIAVYDEPASLFVAHFVGSPGMNFLRGRVARDGAALAFRIEPAGPAIPLPERLRSAALPEGPLLLGVRPEFVRLAESGALRGEVAVDEYLGSGRCLHVKLEGATLAARTPPDAPARAGTNVSLALDPRHVRLFDPTSGARVA
jgi:ABC-type sugar transport system ATPase subunit